jgi:hypothetical protein
VERFRLEFAPPGAPAFPKRPFREAREIQTSTTLEKPLKGLRLAVDPGHIGGNWAEIENRAIRYPGHAGKLCEGDLNLITAKILKSRLTQLGAEVFLTRDTTEPVTETRPETLRDQAYERIRTRYPAKIQRWISRPKEEQYRLLQPLLDEAATFLFYRREEIQARGEKVRKHFKPDATIVLYINATPSSSHAHLIGVNQNIFFVHGAYLKEETEDPEQQPRLLYKLLERGCRIEAGLADSISRAFQRNTKIPPVPYGDSSTTRLVVEGNRYVVARNLAANREYDGPVVVTEPYFMNHLLTNQRLYAGDFDGVRTFGKTQAGSIFREYAESVIDGLLDYYGDPKRESKFP